MRRPWEAASSSQSSSSRVPRFGRKDGRQYP